MLRRKFPDIIPGSQNSRTNDGSNQYQSTHQELFLRQFKSHPLNFISECHGRLAEKSFHTFKLPSNIFFKILKKREENISVLSTVSACV